MTRVALLEPYMTGSHEQWAEGYARSSTLSVDVHAMPGRFWKWRMHGAAATLARRLSSLPADALPDVLLCSDMLDLAAFLGLARRRLPGVPAILYMHENQLAYPAPRTEAAWSDSRARRARRRDEHYPFVNLTSALAADAVVWNSRYNRDSFLDALPTFLRSFPDERELGARDAVAARSVVLPVGMDLAALDAARPPRRKPGSPRIVWNHRWEHDKDPDTFFAALRALDARGARFEVVLLGESFVRAPEAFEQMRRYLGSRLAHFGFASNRGDYARLLWESDVVVSTAKHEFFGVATCEAVHCGCQPVLPNRLAYPELVPIEHAAAVLYDDVDGLVDRLERAVTRPDQAVQRDIAAVVADFDWSRVAPRYDSLVASMRRAMLAVAVVLLLLTARGAAPARTVLAQESRDWSYPAIVNDDGRGATQSDPALAHDGGGSLHAVWVDDRDGSGSEIYYARARADAWTWGPNQRVAPRLGNARRAHPDVAVDAWGNVHAVWLEYVGGDPEIYHSVLSAIEPPWSQPQRVNDDRGPGVQWAPAVAADRYGNVHVVWTDYRDGTADVYHRRLGPDGEWSDEVRVNDVARGEQSMPDIAAAPAGGVFAVWLDTRDGRAAVQASRLPAGSEVWWPNALLSADVDSAAITAPAIAASARGSINAVWSEETPSGAVTMVAATYHSGQDGAGHWVRGREVFRPANGRLLSVDVAGGPGDIAYVTWSESRPGTSRIYAAALPDSGSVDPTRIDGAETINDGLVPRVIVDDAPVAHVAWQGVGRAGHPDVYHSHAPLERPGYGSVESEGWLAYVGRREACGREMHQLMLCDGSPGPLVWTRLPEVATLTGSYVRLSGLDIAEGECPHVEAYDIRLHPSPCPRTTGAVTGVLWSAGRQVEGAVVTVDGLEARTGPSGRFFVADAPPGTQTLTATMACSLVARLDGVSVPSGFQRAVPAGAIVRSDVVEDCAVDLRDLKRTAQSYKSRPPFVPRCVDLDMDGTVSIYDLSIIADNYGRTCPLPWDGGAEREAPTATTAATPAATPLTSPGTSPGASPGTSSDTAAECALAGQRESWGVELTDGRGVRGWEVELSYDDDLVSLVDTDSTQPGLQPFDASCAPAGAFIVENSVDGGRARLAAVVLAPAAPIAGNCVLGLLTVDRSSSADDAGLELARAALATGRPSVDGPGRAGGDVVLARLGGPRGRGTSLHLPLLSR